MCAECGKIFPNKAYLRIHMQTVHITDEQACEQCGKMVKNKMMLSHNMSRYHRRERAKNIQCIECCYRDRGQGSPKRIKQVSYYQS